MNLAYTKTEVNHVKKPVHLDKLKNPLGDYRLRLTCLVRLDDEVLLCKSNPTFPQEKKKRKERVEAEGEGREERTTYSHYRCLAIITQDFWIY